MMWRHPNRKRLRAWLTGDTDEDLQPHLDTCRRCAQTLEAIAEEEAPPIGAALATLLTPPADLTDRLEARVVERVDSRIMFDVLSDLFGAGVETSRLLLTENTPDE